MGFVTNWIRQFVTNPIQADGVNPAQVHAVFRSDNAFDDLSDPNTPTTAAKTCEVEFGVDYSTPSDPYPYIRVTAVGTLTAQRFRLAVV